MRENSVENRLRKRVKELGGRCVKLNPTGNVGIPDRLVILPGGLTIFVELKRPKGGVVSTAQEGWQIWLEEQKQYVEVLWTPEQVDDFAARAKDALDGPPF